MNHVDKYYWIIDHPKLSKYSQATIEMTPHMVNPVNNTIEKDNSLNTKFEWWVEVCYEEEDGDDYVWCHAWELDTGGDSAEEAIDKLYELVKFNYGEY